MARTTPKSLGLVYIAHKAVWTGTTPDGTQVCPYTVHTNYADRVYAKWTSNGYEYARFAATGATIAKKV